MDCSPPGSPIRGISRQEYWSGSPVPSLKHYARYFDTERQTSLKYFMALSSSKVKENTPSLVFCVFQEINTFHLSCWICVFPLKLKYSSLSSYLYTHAHTALFTIVRNEVNLTWKERHCMIWLIWGSLNSQINKKSTVVVSRGWKEEEMGVLLFNGYIVLVWEEEKVLEINGDNDCIKIWTYFVPLNCTYTNVKMINFVYI